MEKPAILGGEPALKEPLPLSNNIGEEEKLAVGKVMDSGVLSDYVGTAGDKFLGGKQVKRLEDSFNKRFNTKYAVSFNSATTALEGAVCALGIGPGDEVIVSPYTMSASATSILMNSAIPVFADVEKDSFCLSPESIKQRITKRTKAVMITNLFGGSARYDEILKITKEKGIAIIEDNAQAAGGMYDNKFLGTIGDIGIFSYNFHKTIHCGEGGMLVTDNKAYAYRAQLKRNHGEVVADDLHQDLQILGSNYRLSEIHAAIAIEQLKKLDFLNERRIELADYLSEKLKEIDGLEPAFVLPQSRHVYYVYPILFDQDVMGMSRSLFARAMKKEGFVLDEGYVKPLYLLNIFRSKKIYSETNCPFDCRHYTGSVQYDEGICPNVEGLWKDELLLVDICRYPLTKNHIDLFVQAIKRIFDNMDEIRNLEE